MKKKRFFKSVVLTLLLLFIISTSLVFYAYKARNIKFETCTVQLGDTLSSISHSIEPDRDWRVLSDKIRYYNKIGPVIYPGQVIKIPHKSN